MQASATSHETKFIIEHMNLYNFIINYFNIIELQKKKKCCFGKELFQMQTTYHLVL